MVSKGVAAGIGVVVVIVVIGIIFVSMSHAPYSAATTTVSYNSTTYPTTTTQSSSGSTDAPMMITDPAQVPNGTSALVFTYTAVQMQDTSPSGTSWVNATGSGSVNLISTLNKTQVMAYANVATNSTISQVRLNITSVMITVNGTTYSVPVSKTQVTIPVSGNGQIGASSGILIDYTPTVSPAFSQNSTIFVRVPAAKAAVVNGINSSFATDVSATAPISANATASIAAVTPNVQITSASLSAQGNTTVLSVTVQNNGNQSVALNTVNVYGAQKVNATASASANVNASVASSVNAKLNGLTGSVGSNLGVSASALATVGLNMQSYSMQTFSAGSSGSLVLVSNLSTVQSGVTVAPGSSATLTFSGTATYNSGTFQTVPKSGSQYRINVVGSTGAYASTNVTAT